MSKKSKKSLDVMLGSPEAKLKKPKKIKKADEAVLEDEASKISKRPRPVELKPPSEEELREKYKLEGDPDRDLVTGRAKKDRQGRPPSKQGGRPAKSMSPKQIRARARRKGYLSSEEMEVLYGKPIKEWDLEELARGRCKNSQGTFSGPNPSFVTREMFDEINRRYKEAVKVEMNITTVPALKVINGLLENDDVDFKGKPVVPAAVKANLAKFLLEHVVGKPTQHREEEISVKLQGLLATVMVQPGEMAATNAVVQAGYPGAAAVASGVGIAGLPGYVTSSVSTPTDQPGVIDVDVD